MKSCGRVVLILHHMQKVKSCKNLHIFSIFRQIVVQCWSSRQESRVFFTLSIKVQVLWSKRTNRIFYQKIVDLYVLHFRIHPFSKWIFHNFLPKYFPLRPRVPRAFDEWRPAEVKGRRGLSFFTLRDLYLLRSDLSRDESWPVAPIFYGSWKLIYFARTFICLTVNFFFHFRQKLLRWFSLVLATCDRGSIKSMILSIPYIVL